MGRNEGRPRVIGVDTSTLVAFLQGESAPDTALLTECLRKGEAGVAPVVITELLSAPEADTHTRGVIRDLYVFPLEDHYWENAGLMRRTLKLHTRKSKVADSLIAQSCIDHGVPLLTRDRDFLPFARHCGLALALEVEEG